MSTPTPSELARRRRTGQRPPLANAEPTAAELDAIAAEQAEKAKRAADAEYARQLARREARCFGDRWDG